MENASKALLIAGAVLIVIVLISVGMMIVQSASGLTGDVDDITSSQAVTAFNSQFENYQGTQKGTSVKTLLGLLSTNNSTNTSGHTISVKLSLSTEATEAAEAISDSTEITKQAASVIGSARYNILVSAKDSLGYITEMEITRVK